MIYQFIPVAPGRVMERLIRSMVAGTMAVLDLEDGYLDVRDPGKTSERRASGRQQLLELCAKTKGRTNGQPVALRVNVAGSKDFMCDLPVVRAVAETFGLASVMLSKVESTEQLRRAHTDLNAEGVEFGALVPIIETRKGLDQIDEIVAVTVELGAAAVAYGHYDYWLDAGAWRFPGTRDKSYWEMVERVAGPVVAAGLRYAHPPEAELRDDGLLRAMLERLRRICGKRFDVFSAGMSQTSVLRRLVGEVPLDKSLPIVFGSPALEPAEKERLAGEACALFEKNNRQEHSFCADSRQGRFISPHEYLAAKNYLREFADALFHFRDPRRLQNPPGRHAQVGEISRAAEAQAG